MKNSNYLHRATVGDGVAGATATHAELVSVNVNTGAASAVLTVYDGTSTTGTTVAVIDASAKGSYWFGYARLHNGLYYTLIGGTADITISYV